MYNLLGNNRLGNIFAEVITIKTLFTSAKPSAKNPTAEVNFEGWILKFNFSTQRNNLTSNLQKEA